MTTASQLVDLQTPAAPDALRQRLADLGRTRRAYAWGAAAVRGLAVWLLVLLAVVLIDAGWALPTPLRWAALALLLVLLSGLVLLHRRRRRSADLELLGDARTLERAAHDRDNALINGVQVGTLRHGLGDTFAAALAERAHRRGLERFDRADTEQVIDRRRLHRQAGNLYAAAAAYLIVALIHPGLLGDGLVRIGLPWADHPPFSLTELAVTIEPTQPRVGEDVAVTVTTSGKRADAAALVVLDDAGREQRRWPLASADMGVFTHRFAAVREPIRFRIEAGDARTRVYQITPRSTVASMVAAEADEATAATAGEDTGGRVGSELPALYERLGALIAQAAALQAQAAELAAAPPTDTDADSLAALEAEVGAFGEEAAALAEALRGEAARQDEPLRGLLQRLADGLEAAGLTRVAAAPMPAAGPGVGHGEAGQWAADVRDAARGAATGLQAMRQNLDDALASSGRLTANPAADGAPPADQPEPDAATGTTTQAQPAADPQRRLREAILEQTPPAYRDLTERYFERLADDTP